MLDVSGSLRDRGYAIREGQSTRWTDSIPSFLARLLEADDQFFAADDLVIVQPFSDAKTDALEKRRPMGPLALGQWSSQTLPVPGAGATDMARALDLTLAHADRQTAPTVLTWLLTDNENNLSGNTSDAQFYQRLRSSPSFSHVYFFPLANPDNQAKDALVLYLLAHTREDDSLPWMEALSDSVEEKTGYGGVLFRPLYSSRGETVLKFDREMVYEDPTNRAKTSQEGGATVITLQEGERLRGRIKFKIQSNLKGWEIVDGRLEQARLRLTVPNDYEKPGRVTLNPPVVPKSLSVRPQQTSLDFFVVSLRDTPVTISRSFWRMMADPFAKWLPSLEGDLRLQVVLSLAEADLEQGPIRPSFSDEMRERVRYVPNLAEIERFMLLQADDLGEDDNQRVIEFQKKLVVKVQASSFPRVMMTLILVSGLVLLGLAIWVGVLWRVRFRLEAPEGNHDLNLSAAFGSYLVCSPTGIPLARLRMTFGSASLLPEPEVTVEGLTEPVPVAFEGTEFRFELGLAYKHEAHLYVLHREQANFSDGPVDEAPSL